MQAIAGRLSKVLIVSDVRGTAVTRVAIRELLAREKQDLMGFAVALMDRKIDARLRDSGPRRNQSIAHGLEARRGALCFAQMLLSQDV